MNHSSDLEMPAHPLSKCDKRILQMVYEAFVVTMPSPAASVAHHNYSVLVTLIFMKNAAAVRYTGIKSFPVCCGV